MPYMSGRIHFRDEKLKYANKNNLLGCKKIPIDLWLNLSEKESLLNSACTVSKHFINQSSLSLYLVGPLKKKKKSLLCAECMEYSVKSGKFHWLPIIFLTCHNIRCARDSVFGILLLCSFCLFFCLEKQWKIRWSWRTVKQLRTLYVIFMESVVRFHPKTQTVPWWKYWKALLRDLMLKPYTSPFKCIEFCICCIWRLYYMADAWLKQN